MRIPALALAAIWIGTAPVPANEPRPSGSGAIVRISATANEPRPSGSGAIVRVSATANEPRPSGSGTIPSQPETRAPIAGQYMEDRTMRVYACPCEWSTDWAHRGREAVLAWNIQSGESDGQSLAGVRLAAVIVGQFSLTEAASPRRSVLYVDSSAPSDRSDAGVRWLRWRYRDLLGEVVAVHRLPVAMSFEPDAVSLEIGSVLSLRMRKTNLAEEARSWAELVHDPFIRLASSAPATTAHVRYSAPDLSIRWVREEDAITGYYGAFSEPSSPT